VVGFVRGRFFTMARTPKRYLSRRLPWFVNRAMRLGASSRTTVGGLTAYQAIVHTLKLTRENCSHSWRFGRRGILGCADRVTHERA